MSAFARKAAVDYQLKPAVALLRGSACTAWRKPIAIVSALAFLQLNWRINDPDRPCSSTKATTALLLSS